MPRRGRPNHRPRPGRRTAALTWTAAALLLTLPAQAQGPIKPVSFRSPDGSRFVLVAIPEVSQVHWVVATPAGASEEPAGLSGLAEAVQQASLNGTRNIGTRDALAETEALEALDQAYAELLATPSDAELARRVAQCQQRADNLGDNTVLSRVLAAAPAHDLRLDVRERTALLQVVTLPEAIGEVGRILVERREHPVLRGLPAAWLREVTERQNAYDRDPMTAIHAELLALALPNHPRAREAGRPGLSMPRRAQAIALWQATQHPSRTVHVLLGNFDAQATRKVLEQTFASTALPAPEVRPAAPPQPLRSQRRSTVPGTGQNVATLAWVLPTVQDPLVLAAAANWIGDGARSMVGRFLRQHKRGTATVTCRAPWPAAIGGRSLLLIEVRDPAGVDGLAELVLEACAQATAKVAPQGDLNRTSTKLQRDWSVLTADPQWHAADLARRALLWPGRPAAVTRPQRIEMTAVHALLRATFAGHPVIVEARP